ncbi:MAG: MerR family transcriptional regulator, light-induced transcriptional regulator [Solirubrobacteraceae bacterium]|nr:MerR family transcriptional regulator, light-induced transcriptional regulator [Solirubrobacteraceae bacterium]
MVQDDLAIKDVADQTGIAAGTIRMWEQRHGFPAPQRTPSGYRRYTARDVETLRRAQTLRRGGLSVAAALERAREAAGASDRPSLYAAVAAADPGARPQVLRKSTLEALSRAIEHETLAHAAAPVLIGAFQLERFYRAIEPRWRRLAAHADAAVVFADFGRVQRPAGRPAEIPVDRAAALGNEWAVVVDAPGLAACLVGWEQPGAVEPGAPGDAERRFEAIWTLDPVATRRAACTAATLASSIDKTSGERLEALLEDRPLALEESVPALTALANRVVGYLERSRERR